MFTPDLPVELWTEILSYLPRTALHKLIGVNRFLFELALDDIYEELRFIEDDRQTEKIFLQMEFPSIARRVKRLLIRPTFLPAMDSDEAENSAQSSRTGLTSKQRLLSHLNRLKYNSSEFRRCVKGRDSKHKSPPAPTTRDILQLVEKAIKLCPNLQDLTVVLHDHMLTIAFMSFLESLWKLDSVGPRLRTLHMDMTLAKIPAFLQPLITPQKVLPNLEIFSIDLAPSRFEAIPNPAEGATSNSYRALVSLRSFFSLFRDSLTSISISTHSAHDFKTLITYLPLHFPNLKRFEVLTIFKVFAHQTVPLFKFLNEHSGQLENLTIKPYPRQTSFSQTDEWYAIWVSPSSPNTPVGGDSFATGFGKLVFPKLQHLDIGLRKRRIHNLPFWGHPSVNAKLVPDLNVLAPNLRSLVLSDAALSFERILDLVDSIGDGGCRWLESIDFVAMTLSPHVFDLFSSKVPRLKMLTVEYQSLSNAKMKLRYHDEDSSFVEAIRVRRYPGWMLGYLRLTVMSSCGTAHPNVLLMNNVAETFSSDIELDGSFRCYCVGAFNSTIHS